MSVILEPPQKKFKKEKCNIELDKVELNVPYAITINPCDKYQYFGMKNRINLFMKGLELDYRVYLPPNYSLYIELSEIGRLHWHGTIIYREYDEVIYFYMNKVNQLLKHCNIKIKPIKDEGWEEYHCKQYIFHKHIEFKTRFTFPIEEESFAKDMDDD